MKLSKILTTIQELNDYIVENYNAPMEFTNGTEFFIERHSNGTDVPLTCESTK